MRTRLILLALPLPLVLAIASRGTGADLPQLIGTVGPDFTITLTDANGVRLETVTAGRYELVVHDRSDTHNFVLGSKATGERYIDSGVGFVGTTTVTIDLVPGLYAYACSPHFTTMNGSLIVRAPPPPAEKRLTARVLPGVVMLSTARVSAGRVRLTVHDRSRSRNFHILGPAINRRTTKAFTGTVVWLLDLDKGVYRFGSDPRLSGRLTVS
jgi:Copper binding proteins, plastocyanin/azurin family